MQKAITLIVPTRLEASTVRPFLAQVERLISSRPTILILDLSVTQYIDPIGLAALRLLRTISPGGVEVVLAELSPYTRLVFGQAELHDLTGETAPVGSAP
jgi:anti-anti-sigma regulatory factor